ncbi:hypothetical protein BGX20_000894, partial [Mortierella sp. AD010]
MAFNVFRVPHIQDSVTENLTFKDLLNCVLVCKSWKREFTPVLWKELHTYCDTVSEPYNYNNSDCYFLHIPRREYRYH